MSLLPAVFLPLASVDAMADDSIFSFRVESGMAFMGHVVWRLYIYPARRGQWGVYFGYLRKWCLFDLLFCDLSSRLPLYSPFAYMISSSRSSLFLGFLWAYGFGAQKLQHVYAGCVSLTRVLNSGRGFKWTSLFSVRSLYLLIFSFVYTVWSKSFFATSPPVTNLLSSDCQVYELCSNSASWIECLPWSFFSPSPFCMISCRQR